MVKLPPSKLSPNQRHIIIYPRVAVEYEDEATIINCIWFLPNVLPSLGDLKNPKILYSPAYFKSETASGRPYPSLGVRSHP